MRTPATSAITAITSGGKPSGTRPDTPTTIRYIARTVIPMLRLNLNAIAPPEDETIQETLRRHNRAECSALSRLSAVDCRLYAAITYDLATTEQAWLVE